MKTLTVSDAGEELKFNRRNRDRALAWSDVASMPGALRASTVKKTAVWPRPDYAKLIDNGMHPLGARILKHAYDAVAASPAKTDDESLQIYIEAVTRVRETVESWVQDRTKIAAFTHGAAAAFGGLMQAQHAETKAMEGQAIDVLSLLTPSQGAQSTARILLNALWPLPPGTTNRFPRGSMAYNELWAIGGNRALTRLQFGYDDIKKMLDDLREGWPAKREAWQVQGYQVLKINDSEVIKSARREAYSVKLLLSNGKSIYANTLDTEQEALAYKQALSAIALVDKYNRLVDSFETEDAAREHARTKVSTRSSVWTPDALAIDKLSRVGVDWRSGKDVTPQQMMDRFGFRGINFGNWVPNDERQKLLNASYDSWSDLATLLDAPPHTIAMDGKLGYAIGAQGNGKHAGHFVPGLNEINATRFAGGGVLSHEWGHFVDHYLATLVCDARGENAFVSAMTTYPNTLEELKKNNPQHRDWLDAFAKVMRTLKRRTESPQEAEARNRQALEKSQKNARSWLKQMNIPQAISALQGTSAQQAENFERVLAATITRGASHDSPHRPIGRTKSPHNQVPEVVAQIWEIATQACGEPPPTAAYKNFAINLYAIEAHRQAIANPTQKNVDTDYFSQSKLMDSHKGGEAYWSTSEELFARAFADWARIKLLDRNQINEHLSSNLHASYAAAKELGLVEANPFLAGEELDAAVQAIDDLVRLLPIERMADDEKLTNTNGGDFASEQRGLFDRP